MTTNTGISNHLLAEYYDCDVAILDDIEKLEAYLKEAVLLSGATIVKSVFHQFSPYGVTGVIVIEESHISIHTWPEYNYAAVDFFTCNPEMDYHKTFQFLKKQLGASDESEELVVSRGKKVLLNKLI